MTTELSATVLTQGLCFGEGPRFHDGQLWLSDMHAHQVLRIDSTGSTEKVLEVPACPSGLGWLPDGDLLVVSMEDRRVLRFDGKQSHVHANLSDIAPYHCNDMVVDRAGRAYVGNFGFNIHAREKPTSTVLTLVEPSGTARVVADDLMFPNGMVITDDGQTLVVAETFAGRLSAFTVAASGDLSGRRLFAELPKGTSPDGICLDAEGGIWVASPTTNETIRVLEGGEITHRVGFDRGAYACMIGDGRLYTLTAEDADPRTCAATQSGRIEVCAAPYPGAGRP